ncbi:hypothetical protein [Corynebacterium cystitidis]|uniref:hypothetical protein n=1 Tax=Corynebacterium cystitidis TaxID=35757 RepID=UPI00211EF8D5|nr:hypothetical protein [Corynebacterium cystitidis]
MATLYSHLRVPETQLQVKAYLPVSRKSPSNGKFVFSEAHNKLHPCSLTGCLYFSTPSVGAVEGIGSFSSLDQAPSATAPSNNFDTGKVAVPQSLALPQGVKKAVEENTDNATSVLGEGEILFDGTVRTKEQLNVAVELSTPKAGKQVQPEVNVLERQDGVQMIATLDEESGNEIKYQLEGKEMILTDTGYVLVFDEIGQDPSYIIDPAWAQDSEGNEVATHYRVEGDTLIQSVELPQNGNEVYADPYYRNSVVWGNFPTSDLILTRAETATLAAGGGACAIIRHYATGVVCAVLATAAGVAAANNRCVGARDVYLPGTNPRYVNGSPFRRVASWPITVPC